MTPDADRSTGWNRIVAEMSISCPTLMITSQIHSLKNSELRMFSGQPVDTFKQTCFHRCRLQILT